MKIISLSVILWFVNFSIFAQSKTPFVDVVEQWSADPDLSPASVSVFAVDLKSNSTLIDYNGHKARIPASLMKISTTAAALDLLGPEFTVETSLWYNGFIDDSGVLHGDIILSGEGDPTFGSLRLGQKPDWLIARFAESLKRLGISRVLGNVWVETEKNNKWTPGTWTWEDLANYYAATPRGVNFLENQFAMVFTTRSSGEPAELVNVTPEIQGLEIDNQVISADISGDQTFCFGHPEQNFIEVKGKLPANRAAYTVKGAIPQPGLFFAQTVMKAAKNNGLEWEGEIQESYRPADRAEDLNLLMSYTSPPLKDMVRETNQHSINLYAEALFAQMSKAKRSGDATLGIEVLEEYWKSRLDKTAGLLLKDGSGLSGFNTITAAQLVQMLQLAHDSPHRDIWLESLPVSGKGALRRMGAGTILENNLQAKSGYLTGNRGYAGYLNLKSGRKIAFALMVNHYDISASAMRQKMEALLVAIAEIE